LIGLGLVGIAINQMLFVSGMALTTVAHAAITIGLTPMVVLMLAAAIGQERLSAARMAGMAVALAGVAVLQLAPDNAKGASLLGDVLVFSGGFLFALFTVHSKAQATRIDGITLNTFAYVSGAAALLPVTVWLSLGHPFERVTGAAWLSLVYMAVGPSVVCYLIFYHALSHISASRVSAFAYLQPLIATVIAVPTLGEYPSGALLAGGILVLSGVCMAERL
jgi:drug/metabolite transporter (DMT)-like permease